MKQRDLSLSLMGLGALAQMGGIAFGIDPVMLIMGMFCFFVGFFSLVLGKDD